MTIELSDLGKRFNRQWIFRHLDATINPGDQWAITGHNGSGKSTLLKIIGGFMAPTKGKINFSANSETHQLHFSIATPYLNVIEEFTLSEHLDFHKKFKTPLISNEEILRESGLQGSANKPIMDFSSGMKQRLRLSMAFFFQSEVVLLDEPTSNLDEEGISWYQQLIKNHLNRRTLIIASNQKNEYSFCQNKIDIEQFK